MRHADKLEELAAVEADEARKAELLEMARVCRQVPAHAPSTFPRSVAAFVTIHLGVVTELNAWDAFDPGRLDQHLNPFYQAGNCRRLRFSERASHQIVNSFG